MFLFWRQSILVTKLEPSFQGFASFQRIRGDDVLFKVCTMHYMLGYCVWPPGLCCHNEPFGFGGLSLCKKALQAIFHKKWRIFMCIYICRLPFMQQKAVLLFVFLCRSGDWSWMWIWGGQSNALLGLDNQCMAQIPLSENTLATQLIINSIFFEGCFFSCQLVLGWGRSKAAQWSLCVTLMSLLESRRAPNSHVPTTDVVAALKGDK